MLAAVVGRVVQEEEEEEKAEEDQEGKEDAAQFGIGRHPEIAESPDMTR